jgi:hypothetical protein
MAFFLIGFAAQSQQNSGDSIISRNKNAFVLSDTIDYEDPFQDFDAFMDSILSPHSYFLASLSVNRGFYSFQTKNISTLIEPTRKLTYSPILAYCHKNGIGFTTTGSIINDGQNINLYQFSITPSYDYLENKSLATGVSFTKFFTKDSLPFYTTPLQNELYGYFTYRKLWIRPTIAASYGWGSRKDYMKRESVIQDLRLRRSGYTYINTEESVSDFSLLLSVRHDFYWLDVIAFNDHIRFTPQITLTSGTQKFGFNQTSSTYATVVRTGSNVLYSTEEIYLDDQIKFQPLSLSLFLRGEYAIKKFFIQPQLALDYYFPAEKNNFATMFSLNLGFMF